MSEPKLLVANWKMNLPDGFAEWGQSLKKQCASAFDVHKIALCPPSTHISVMRDALPEGIDIGGQDCSEFQKGAHTGDISATMLVDLGCKYVIIGHSERRTDHHETNEMVKAKVEQAFKAGLTPILCVGEKLADREAGHAEAVVSEQMLASLPDDPSGIVLAYEPIWAIGTGRTATPADAESMHAALRQAYPHDDRENVQILYGGSVKPNNAKHLLDQANIDGALVGGASLNPLEFSGIINAAS